jgi:hypothetical protein
MSGKNQTCTICGYKISRSDRSYLTQWQGKSAHVGCVRQKVISQNRTQAMFDRIAKKKQEGAA